MVQNQDEIRVRGRSRLVPSIEITGRTIIATGRWLKIAAVKDEAFVEGEVVTDPELFIDKLKKWEAKPDIFMFCQKITDAVPKFAYTMEWDDFAVIRITTYDEWLRDRIKKDVKENVRRARREGVIVKAVEFNDTFVQGVKDLYDETPIRQGKPFWHYGKPFESVKNTLATYCDRAEYIGAYFERELIGFIKMVYVGDIAKTMHVISKERYHLKRPTNALIAKAVEICEQKGILFFIYGEYNFPGTGQNSLTEFKRRHGFEEMRFPRYFVPLTAKGRFAMATGIHSEARKLIPMALIRFLVKARSIVNSVLYKRQCSMMAQAEPTITPPIETNRQGG